MSPPLVSAGQLQDLDDNSRVIVAAVWLPRRQQIRFARRISDDAVQCPAMACVFDIPRRGEYRWVLFL